MNDLEIKQLVRDKLRETLLANRGKSLDNDDEREQVENDVMGIFEEIVGQLDNEL